MGVLGKLRVLIVGVTLAGLSALPWSGPQAKSLEEYEFGSTQPQDTEALDASDAVARGRAAAMFSWRTFAALQWSAQNGARGVPTTSLDQSAQRVWETWKEPYEVYLPDGRRPANWEVQVPPPGIAAPLGLKTLVRRTKVSESLNEKVQATQADGSLPPLLTDQNGKLVRYEIRMNRIVFDHIRKNKLYDGNVQATTDEVSYPNGACLLKASWKELAPHEQERYIAADCWILEKDGSKRRQRMGLVGFHIMVKTPSAPQWIWATFEQIDNLDGEHPSFFDPSKTGQKANQQTAAGVPSQVTRVVPIPTWLRGLNREIQASFAKQDSPLQYYELVETQRPIAGSQPKGAPSTVFSVEPPLLSNTTQETFVQNSSCMGCHSMAGTLNSSQFVSGDFTFTLNEAHPKPKNLDLVPAPLQPESQWDRDHWTQIQRGLKLANNTYELLPKNVGAKLHCTSCHLDNGGNPQASWWVGMDKDYDYPATDELPKRIDRCFTHSMNGKPLSESELPNSEMNALITYMQWLDKKARAADLDTSRREFPPLPEMTGDSQHGEVLYQQKCAFCHSTDGEGRYLSDTYFRPALWGSHSWPKIAGLGKDKTLAEFLKANMPLGSGGMLTNQEAWDLAAYLNSKARP